MTTVLSSASNQQKQQQLPSQNNGENVINGATLVDLWSQYWSGNPLLDVWHCQTFARMTAKSFSESSTNSWSSEIKKMIETVCVDLRMKQLRSFFSRQEQKQQDKVVTNKNSKQNEKSEDAAAASVDSSSSSSICGDFVPSSTIEISTSPSGSSNHISPRDVFDLYQTLLVSTRDQQQTTILDFEFTGTSARVTFANPLVAQRVASSLQGLADVKILSKKELRDFSSKYNVKPNVLLLRGVGLTNLYNQIRIGGFSLLFSIFGEPPKVELISTSPVILRIEFTSSSSSSSSTRSSFSIAPSKLQLTPQEEFLFVTSSSSTLSSEELNEDDAPQVDASLLTNEVLKYLSSCEESAMNALVHLQRPLAEDWGFMLTFERK